MQGLTSISSYLSLWVINLPKEKRVSLESCFPNHVHQFLPARAHLDNLLRRLASAPSPLILVWNPHEVPTPVLETLAAQHPVAFLIQSPLQDDETPGLQFESYCIAPFELGAQGRHVSFLTEMQLQRIETDQARMATAKALLQRWRDSQACFNPSGRADMERPDLFEGAEDDQKRIVVIGHNSGSNARQNLSKLASQVQEVRQSYPHAFLSVVSNCALTTNALASLDADLQNAADHVSYLPWRADFVEGADIIACGDPGLCLDAFLRGSQVHPLGHSFFGLQRSRAEGRQAAIIGALAEQLIWYDGQKDGRVTLSQAIDKFDAIARNVPADEIFGIKGVQRQLHVVEAFRQSEDLDAACKVLSAQVETYPEEADLWLRMGDLQSEREDFDAALHAYNQVIALDPTMAEAYSRRAQVRIRGGEMVKDVGEDFLTAFRKSNGTNYAFLESYFDFEWERTPINEEILKTYQRAASRAMARVGELGEPGGKFYSRLAAMQFEAGMRDPAKRMLKQAIASGEIPASFLRVCDALGKEAGMRPIQAGRQRALAHISANSALFTDLLDEANGDIAIVGNGPQELGRGLGAQIDSHGMVVRFNTYSTAFPQSHDYGTKTDLWVRMPATGYVKTEMENACQNVMVTGVNRLNRSTSLWDWADVEIQAGRQIAFVPKDPYYELIEKLGMIPTAGLLLAYMLYRETGPVDPARIFGCSFAEDMPVEAGAAYHHSDTAAASGSRHDFDVEHAFFQTIRKTEAKHYYLPKERRQMERDIPTLSIDSPPPAETLWTAEGQTGRYDRVLSVTPGLTGYTVFGCEVEVVPRGESNALLEAPKGTVPLTPERFPTYAAPGSRRRTLILGFGLGPTGQLGQRVAEHLGMPYMSVEYGLISSCHLPSEKQFNFSLILDDLGAFFDTQHRSRLEAILDTGFGVQTSALTKRARAFMDTVLAYDITKYNNSPRMVLPPRSEGKKRILVIDQTSGDLSIKYGQCETYSFQDMLEHAMARPDAEVFFKPHPETLAGAKGANFDIDALRKRTGLTVLEENCNIMSLMPQVDEVYVMVSGVGFEALMAGKTVRCFGVPFYAGRGLTIDMVEPSRPRRPLSIEELVAGVFLQYHQFYDPDTGVPVSPEACLERLLPKLPRETGLVHDGNKAWGMDLTHPVAAEAFEALRQGRTPLDLAVAKTMISQGDTVADASDGPPFFARGVTNMGIYRVHAVSESVDTNKILRKLDDPAIRALRKTRRPARVSAELLESAEPQPRVDRLDGLLEGEPLSLLRIAHGARSIDVLETAEGLFKTNPPQAVMCRLSKTEIKRASQYLQEWYAAPVEFFYGENGTLETRRPDVTDFDLDATPGLYLFRLRAAS